MEDQQTSPAVTVDSLRTDLHNEQQSLDHLVRGLTDHQWSLHTSAAGWTVRDQIAHLAYFDAAGSLALQDPDQFDAHAKEFLAHVAASPDGMDTFTLTELRTLSPSELLQTWRDNRSHFEVVSSSVASDQRVPWYGPSMGAKSFLTARLMETWAHGQDVADAISQPTALEPTDRLFHIARLGFNTRSWSYKNRKLEPPTSSVSVSLTSPSGAVWNFGKSLGATPEVVGSANDFCLVVTQRRHLEDTNLTTNSEDAREWLLIAQAFAGPPTQTERR